MPFTNYIYRWQVREPDGKWTYKGPDLLRLPTNAAEKALAMVPRLGLRLEVNRHDGTGWHKIQRKGLLWQMNNCEGPAISVAQVKLNGTRVIRAQLRRVRVPIRPLANTSPDTITVHSLIQFAFPGISFGGSYVWKTQPGGMSDHAWGTAVDETQNPSAGVYNDDVIDWVSRMGQSGNMVYDYALGSRDGYVVAAVKEEGYVLRASSADTSHLWHTHVSVVNHHGAYPPREGGVW